MTDNTQTGSDNDVTRKDTPTEVVTHSIKGVQAELDDILKPLRDFGEDNAHGMTWEYSGDIAADIKDDTATVNRLATEAKQAILDWHNKQTEEVLDRLCSDDKMYWDGACVNYLVRKSVIEAERDKLKEAEL